MAVNPFTRQTIIKADVPDVFAWHARPGAIERLSPPWDPLEVVHQSGGIQKGAEVILKMRAGPLKYNWHARHTAYQENHFFADEQIRGPFAYWKHTHQFTPATDSQCLLEDRIEYRPPLTPLTHPFIKGMIHRKLSRIFAYRHRVTAADLSLHLKFKDCPRKTVLISGASGLIGARLVPLLTTGGHEVVKLVRRQPSAKDEIFWDPAENWIDKDSLNKRKVDAVIHLAGENVGTGRWTARKKEAIIQSRKKGTALLINTVAALKHPPRDFLSASAIGLYGHCRDTLLTETDGPGDGFLADVCRCWEDCAQDNNVCRDIRTVLMRIGVVLTPEGGALQKLLLPFSLGLGGRIGAGRQYLSWISIDDALSAIYHLLMEDKIAGPVNLVAPHPVTNADFTKALAAVLSRPAMLPLPARLIQLLFGQMGQEVLLSSTRVHPKRLLETGYGFRHPEITASLRHVLGKSLSENPQERN